MAFFKETTTFFKGTTAYHKFFNRKTDIRSGTTTNNNFLCECFELYDIRGGVYNKQSWPYPGECGDDCLPRGVYSMA